MRYAQRGYLLLLNGMALLAAIMLVWLMVAVVLSVVIRNLGLQPSAWFFSVDRVRHVLPHAPGGRLGWYAKKGTFTSNCLPRCCRRPC